MSCRISPSVNTGWSSGIPNFTNLPDYHSMKVRDTPVAKAIVTVRDKPLDFPPGEKMSYSNSGYLLLGYVIEQVAGTSYEKFVTDNIFSPLGMKDSGYDSNAVVIPRRAAGYTPSPSGMDGSFSSRSRTSTASKPIATT